MSGFLDAIGNEPYLKAKFLKNVAAGEKASAAEFKMTIEEYPKVEVLVRTTQFPAMGRTDVEDFGQMGMGINQQGPIENKGEIAVTCVETLTGPVIGMMRDIVRNKRYVTVKIEATPESTLGQAVDDLKFRLLMCKLRSDAIDLSTEDTSALIKPSITVQYNWVDH
ncbi:baseplate protein [Vibrio fluvialis]|uniref:baseplate protein n=1 Tax=Vibrio fluvialis TaxID=676 RepID=UPI001EEBF5B2|nr:baseplate protein [Vibrio fluvialis]MCG6387496.1 baseplate protein [Vibrio fluvialis]MCG6418792.1 baseplate protein [Vibrio fluvialis]